MPAPPAPVADAPPAAPGVIAAPMTAPLPAPAPAPMAETSEPMPSEPVADAHVTVEPVVDLPAADAPVASGAEPPAAASSVFSDMAFDAFAPGEAAPPTAAAASWDVVPTPPPAEPAEAAPAPPDGGAWVSAQREAPPVPVFAPDAWDEAPAAEPSTAAPAEAPAAESVEPPFVPPADADDFLFISTITEDVQRALYLAGVTKLEEIAHWSRSDARRISAAVGVSEETIMNQWVFEAQGALFERYSSHVGG